jgi:betaine-aldehyde dehydrogenase
VAARLREEVSVTSSLIAPAMVIGREARAAADGSTYPVYEPARGCELARVPSAQVSDVDAAVRAAQSACAEWKALGPMVRAERVRAFAQTVREHQDELATIDARNTGNPIRWTRFGVQKGSGVLDFFGGLAIGLAGRTIPATADHLHYTVREPFGVVGVITAFNHPTLFATGRIAAPLIAGNCVVLKPAEQTPLSAIRLAQLALQHFPDGVFNVVTGGALPGDALVRHSGVKRINFTGSLSTALRIQASAADSGAIKRLGLQLSGKNPLIVLPDVDVDIAAGAAIEGMNLHKVMGQSCGSTSRAFVPKELYADFVTAVSERLGCLRIGDPLDESTELGALISAHQRDRVESYVAAGVSDGAKLITGGRRPQQLDLIPGFYYEPTLFGEVRPTMRIAQEEIFGPVLSVIPWSDEDHMLRAVNAVRYGLTASIYTNDLRAAHRVAAAVDAGYIWVNDVEKRWVGVPFGGFKDSGTSTEFSIEELDANSQLKAISITLS